MNKKMTIRISSRNRMAAISIVLFGMLGGQAPRADELQVGLLTESEFLGEVPTIVSASRMPQLQSEAPAAVTIIDADMIEASGARNISDLLMLVPGFQVGNFNSSKPVATYHGLADEYPRNMQVLIDGRSVYSPMFRGAFWSDLTVALENIERIEVIRGPNTVTYGSNAFFGVINIITRHASQQIGTYLKGAVGDNGIRDMLLRHGWRSGEHNFRITGSWQESEGFESRTDDVQAGVIDVNADFRLSTNDVLEVNAGINKNEYTEDFIGTGVPVSPHTREVTSSYQQLRWRRSISQTDELSIQLFHQYRDQKLEVVTDPIDLSLFGLGVVTVPIDLNASEDRYDLELQHILRPAAPVQLVWGVGMRLDQMESQSFFADNEIRENRVNRLFSSVEWRATEKMIVNGGAIIEDSDIAGTDISPRLALNYHLTSSDTIRTSISRATRMPALVEDEGNQQFTYAGLLFDQGILGGGGLVTEKITTGEVAYLGRALGNKISWGVRVYRDVISDRITEIIIPALELFPEREAFSFVNAGEIEVNGQELEFDYQATEDLRVVLNYAHMDAKSRDYGSIINLSRRARTLIKSVPNYSYSTLIMYRFVEAWQASLLVSGVDDMEWLGDGDYVKGHTRIDVNLAREFQFGGTSARLSATVQRLGSEYLDFRIQNVSDRRYFVSFGVLF
ncbi:MAG: TonB-dependent receptor [Gammaproteobacteria bacterium]|nr:TonB-dependent receptor [Gammaproteobacteria bacterium]